MRITTPGYNSAFVRPAGTPIVALNAAGTPVAVGLRMSLDPDKKQSQLGKFTSRLADNPDKVEKWTTALSNVVDIAAETHPGWAQQAAATGDVLAFFATGARLVNAANEGDDTDLAIASLKCGSNALAVLSDSGVLGAHPMLHMVVLVSKALTSLADIAYTPPKPMPLYFSRPRARKV